MTSEKNIKTSLIIVTEPVDQPITPNDAKAQARLETDSDDPIITTMIDSARVYLETIMHRSFIETEWEYTLDCFPSSPQLIRPTRAPLISVESITYLDANGSLQTLASSEYTVDTRSEFGRIVAAENKSWPITQNEINAVIVKFKAGYGTKQSSIPKDIQAAIKLLVAYWYENREAFTLDGKPEELPMALQVLIEARTVPDVN